MKKIKENGSGKCTCPMLKNILLVFSSLSALWEIFLCHAHSHKTQEAKVALRLFPLPRFYSHQKQLGSWKMYWCETFQPPSPQIIFMPEVVPGFYSFWAKMILGKRKEELLDNCLQLMTEKMPSYEKLEKQLGQQITRNMQGRWNEQRQ